MQELWLKLYRAYDQNGQVISTNHIWLGVVIKDGKIYDYDFGRAPYEFAYDGEGHLSDWVGNEYTISIASTERLNKARKTQE